MHNSSYEIFAASSLSRESIPNNKVFWGIFGCVQTFELCNHFFIQPKTFFVCVFFRVEVSLLGSIKLTVFTLLYASAYMMVLIYQNIIFDPRDIQDFYGTLAASGLIACRIAGEIARLLSL